MSAAGRLVRRAPWWRLTVAAAASFAALAWLYPDPALLALLRRGGALAPAAPAPSMIGVTPSMDAVVSGTVRLGGGRTLPLPAGQWHEFLVVRGEEDAEFDVVALARVDHGAATGLIVALSTVTPVRGGAGHRVPGLPFGCFDQRSLATGPPAADGSGPRDCWFAHAGALAALDPSTVTPLARRGITVPPLLTAFEWTRAEHGDLERVTFMFPGNTPALLATRTAWMRRWRPLLRRGFDGPLAADAAPDHGAVKKGEGPASGARQG